MCFGGLVCVLSWIDGDHRVLILWMWVLLVMCVLFEILAYVRADVVDNSKLCFVDRSVRLMRRLEALKACVNCAGGTSVAWEIRWVHVCCRV